MTTHEAATRYTQAGLHVVPIRGDGSKGVALKTWKEYQSRPARPEELDEWFAGREDRGVAILGGNGLEVLDFDRPGIFEEFKGRVEQEAPGLIDRIPRVSTPGGGEHLYYRCERVERNQKLARDADGKTLIETRGEGGYVLAPPSPPCCHPKNQPYVHAAGPEITQAPHIDTEERDILLDVARSLDHRPKSASYYRGREFVEKAPLARSEHGGHNTTFAVTRHLTNDLGLPPNETRLLLDRYNERLGEAGEEKWTEAELDHKVASAQGERPDLPFGGGGRANDPHRLARTFIARRPWVFWNGRHFEYDGTRYAEVPDYEMTALLTRHIKNALDADHQARLSRGEESTRRPVASRTQVNNTRLALEALCLVRGTVLLPSLLPHGKAADLLALSNGLLDLDTGELRPHTPKWFSLVCLPYAFDPDAKCPHWLEVLGQNLEGDRERIELLQQFFGYTLLNSTDAQRFLFLVGEGANGKSVVLAGLHAMLGENNVSTVPLEDFGRRFAMAQTLGRLANISPEVGELDRTAEGTLKAFVSGDRMTFERKGKDAFTARPTARLVLSTNNVPRFADKSEGVWRRLLLVPFNRRVPAGERVTGMDKPEYWLQAEEAPGILNWALEGMRRLKANGMRFTEPAACRAALEEHRIDSDPCRAFLQENYAADSQAKPLRARELYDSYRLWCEENGFRSVSANNLGRQVRRVFGLEESRPYRFGHEVAKAWLGLAVRKPKL
jgi:P4 family phage/plasmid primase-like protien